MSLASALEGLRQAEKQLQWVKFAQDALTELQNLENKKNEVKREHTSLSSEIKDLKEKKAKLSESVKELHAKEEEAAKKYATVVSELQEVNAAVEAAYSKKDAEEQEKHLKKLAALKEEWESAWLEFQDNKASLQAEIARDQEQLAKQQEALAAFKAQWSN